MAEKEIYLDIKTNNKELKYTVDLLVKLEGVLGSIQSEADKEITKKTISALKKEIEELAKVEQKRAKETLPFGIKKLEFSKLELQKQKELLKQEKQRASETSKAIKQEESEIIKLIKLEEKAIRDKYNEEEKELNRLIKLEDLARSNSAKADEKELNRLIKLEEDAIKNKLALENKLKKEKERSAASIKAAQLKVEQQAERARAKQLSAAEKVQNQLDYEVELLSREAKSYQELAEQTAILTKRRKLLNITTKEGRVEFLKLTEAISVGNSKLKEFDGEIGNFQRNVGDYKNQIAELIPAAGALGNALRAVALNPFFALMAVAVTVLGALTNAFTKTEKGQKLMARITGVLNAGMSMLVKVAEDVANVIIRLGTEPVAVIKDLGESIKQEVIDRFDAAVKSVSFFADIFRKLWDKDFEGAGEAAKNFGKELTKATTGIDVDKVSDLTDEIDKQVEAFAALEVQKLNNIKANRALEISIAKLTTEQEVQAQQADNATVSLLDQKASAEELTKANEVLAQKQAELANNRLSILNKEIKLRKANGEVANDLEEQRKDAYIAAIEAERAYTLVVGENSIRLRQIRQDLAEQSLDYIIDGFDNQKAINERIVGNDRTTAEQRRSIVEETKILNQKALSDEVAVLQGFAKEQIDINDLLATSDAKLLDEKAKKLGLSEALTLRLLEVVRDQRTAQQDLLEFEQEANQQSYDLSLERYEKELELEQLKFESKKTTDQEKAIYEIGQQIALNQEKLRLQEEFNIGTTDLDTQLLEQQIANDEKLLESKNKLSEATVNAVDTALAATIKAAGEETKVGKALGIVQKGLAIGKITLSIAEGVAATAAIGYPQNIPALIGLAAQVAGLIGTVASVKFERGGVIDGASHAQGGVPILGGRAEVEGGEYIVNKKSTAAFMPLLDQINSHNGWGNASSTPMFATGGVLPFQDQAVQQQAPIIQTITQPVLVVSDVSDIQGEVAMVEAIQGGL